MKVNRYPEFEEESSLVREPMVANHGMFTPAQVELLSAMAYLHTDEEVNVLKHAISEFFARRADEEMEKLWESGEWNDETLEKLKTSHFRTPYNTKN